MFYEVYKDEESLARHRETPPFGLLVYTVKAAIRDEDETVSVMEILWSSAPYWLVMLTCMIAIVAYPQITAFLPELVF